MLNIAKFITFILHPIILISPAVFLIVFLTTGDYAKAFFWMLIALGSAGIVAAYILFGMKKGFFSNFDVSQRQQRIYLFPFIGGIGVLFLISLALFRGPIELFLSIFYFVIAISVLALVNLRIKASVHVGSLTAIVVGAIYFFGPLFSIFLIFVPVMAWARVVEKRHTLRETIVGSIVGAVLAMLGIIIVQYFI